MAVDCPEGQTRDKITKECRDKKKPGRKSIVEPCPEGQIRDKVTKECREKKRAGKKTGVVAPSTPSPSVPAPPPRKVPVAPKVPVRPKVPVAPKVPAVPRIPTPVTPTTSNSTFTSRGRQLSKAEFPCGRVMTLKQYTETCWFNALLMGLFYSQGMRAVMMETMDQWKAPRRGSPLDRFYDTVKDMLLRKYLFATEDWSKKRLNDLEIDAKTFRLIKPDHLLSMLNKIDKKQFVNRGISQTQKGGWGSGYLYHVMQLLYVKKAAYLDAHHEYGPFYKSYMYGASYTTSKDYPLPYPIMDLQQYYRAIMHPDPDIIVIHYQSNILRNQLKTSYSVQKADQQTFIYNGHKYVADSLYLSNFNKLSCQFGHIMAGVTCGNKRYMYNGWAKDTVDRGMISGKSRTTHPCHLMPFDWTGGYDFCINKEHCDLPHAPETQTKDVYCFNPNKGGRYIIAVKEEILARGLEYDTKLATLGTVCPDRRKAFNPATNVCVDVSMSYYNILDHKNLHSPAKLT